MKVKALVIAFSAALLSGCTILRTYPKRSDLTLKAIVSQAPEKSVEVELNLHGNNQDIMQEYITGLKYTLEQLGLERPKP